MTRGRVSVLQRRATPASSAFSLATLRHVEKRSTALVKLTTAPNEIAAEEIRALLGTEGIDSMLRIIDFGVGTMDESAVSGSREIFVRSGDVETARALIGEV